MNKVETILSNLTDIAKSSLPVLDYVSLGLGTGLSCALAYYERQGQRNLEMFVTSLDERLKDLELEAEKIHHRFEKQASFIVEVLDRVKKEKFDEKIHFYAEVTAEIIRNDVEDLQLKQEFVNIIAELSGMELIILKALEGRKRGEVLTLSPRGGTFLQGDIVINDTTLAWIDSLIRKGLVIDASIQNVQSGYTSNPRQVTSRSAIRLSDLARIMIEYMRSVQLRK